MIKGKHVVKGYMFKARRKTVLKGQAKRDYQQEQKLRRLLDAQFHAKVIRGIHKLSADNYSAIIVTKVGSPNYYVEVDVSNGGLVMARQDKD